MSALPREEELRRQDQTYVDENEEEQRNNQDPDKNTLQDEKRGQIFEKWMRHGSSELSSEEKKALRELRAQGVASDEKGGLYRA